MTVLSKIIKSYQIFLDIIGTLLGMFLFIFSLVITHGLIVESLGVSLGGFILPIMVFISKHED